MFFVCPDRAIDQLYFLYERTNDQLYYFNFTTLLTCHLSTWTRRTRLSRAGSTNTLLRRSFPQKQRATNAEGDRPGRRFEYQVLCACVCVCVRARSFFLRHVWFWRQNGPRWDSKPARGASCGSLVCHIHSAVNPLLVGVSSATFILRQTGRGRRTKLAR